MIKYLTYKRLQPTRGLAMAGSEYVLNFTSLSDMSSRRIRIYAQLYYLYSTPVRAYVTRNIATSPSPDVTGNP